MDLFSEPCYSVCGSKTRWFWIAFPNGLDKALTLDSGVDDFPPNGISSSRDDAEKAAIAQLDLLTSKSSSGSYRCWGTSLR